MRLQEIKERLANIKTKGFIPSLRKGPTGVGHTLLIELNLAEDNIPIPDIGGRVEVKGTRAKSKTPITHFTYNRGVWNIKQKELVEKYGYIDKNDRKALYCLVSTVKPNPQGLKLLVDKERGLIQLFHDPSQEILATWSIYVIVGKFMTKMDRLLLVFADNRLDENVREVFYYTDAFLLTKPSDQRFLTAFEKGIVQIDIRMHLKENGGVRNHGTAFRCNESDLKELYDNSLKVL